MKAGLTFTETLQGHLSFGEHDPQRGANRGSEEGNKIFCHLEVNVGDVERFHLPPQPDNAISGWVYSSALGQRLPVARGSLKFFVESNSATTGAVTYQLRYLLLLFDDLGHPLTVVGVKTVGGNHLGRIWRDATTVYIHLYKGDRYVDVVGMSDAQLGRVHGLETLAAGIINVRPFAFLKQLTTFRATDYRSVLRFGSLFTKRLLGAYTSAGTRADRRAR
jgi:hypothetical protein